QININLASTIFVPTDDGQPDAVIINGTNGDDHIQIVGSAIGATSLTVAGLSAQVNITNSEPIDHLTVNALAGNDTVDSSRLDAGVIGLTVNLGDGQAPTPTLTPNQVLTANQSVSSPNGQYQLVMQGDGNLVEYGPGGQVIWHAATNGNPGARAIMQGDGNL